MNDILRDWTHTYDAMTAAIAAVNEEMEREIADLVGQIEAAQAEVNRIVAPFHEQMAGIRDEHMARLAELERDLYPLALAHGQSYGWNGARIAFRKGYRKVTFDPARTDTVLATLRDVLPGTAAALAAARKETEVAPSVRVERVTA